MNDIERYLRFGKFTKPAPNWLLEKVKDIDNSVVDEEYIKKILRIIDAHFDKSKFELTTTTDLHTSRYISTHEVLQKRQNSCGSLATVIASTLRAINIPTKLIHGHFIKDGVSCLHAWNEVYLGEKWIAFDIRGKQRGISEFHQKEAEMVDWSEMQE